MAAPVRNFSTIIVGCRPPIFDHDLYDDSSYNADDARSASAGETVRSNTDVRDLEAFFTCVNSTSEDDRRLIETARNRLAITTAR